MSGSSHHPSPIPSADDKYERTDLPARPIYLSLGFISVYIALSFVAMYGATLAYDAFIGSMRPETNPLVAKVEAPVPPLPRLQARPAKDMEELRAAEAAVLHHYAWVDKGAGKVRIPIDKAIELVAKRGLPARDGGNPRP